jgi:hypothetical protein
MPQPEARTLALCDETREKLHKSRCRPWARAASRALE